MKLRVPVGPGLLPNDLHQHPLPSPPVKLSVENLFPGAKVEFAFGDRDDDFAAHDLAFHVRVGIVLPGAVVVILRSWRMRSELLKPDVVIVEKSIFGVVDVNAGRDVHGVAEHKTVDHAAFLDQVLDSLSDVDVAAPVWNFEPKVLCE